MNVGGSILSRLPTGLKETKVEYLAEIQMLSLALQGNWAGVEKIAVIMEVEALRHFVGTCGRLGYQCGDIISEALARAADEEPF